MTALAFSAFTAGGAQAAVLFFDDFENNLTGGYQTVGSGQSTNTFDNWTVTQGNIDLLAAGFGGCPSCIDLDGTGSGVPARLESTQDFTFLAGVTYTLTFSMPVGTGNDAFEISFGGGTEGFLSYSFPLQDSIGLLMVGQVSGKIVIEMLDTPNDYGPYLDWVRLEDDTVSAVPLPAGAPLLLAGLLGLAALRRRRGA